MKQEDPSIVLYKRNRILKDAIHHHVLVYGWPEVAKVLRAEIFVHVGWDSIFTELDNVLRRIANVPLGEALPPKPETCEDRSYRCCEGPAELAPQGCIAHLGSVPDHFS